MFECKIAQWTDFGVWFPCIADLFGKQNKAAELFLEFDSIELEISSRISSLNETNRPTVVMEHHASLTRDPVVLTGTSQWTDIIEKAGGINVFKDLPGHTTHVDMEAILDTNPDVIMFDGITFDVIFSYAIVGDEIPPQELQFVLQSNR
mgnify:CR=1 FL=1